MVRILQDVQKATAKGLHLGQALQVVSYFERKTITIILLSVVQRKQTDEIRSLCKL
jgi:hypothetical protein